MCQVLCLSNYSGNYSSSLETEDGLDCVCFRFLFLFLASLQPYIPPLSPDEFSLYHSLARGYWVLAIGDMLMIPHIVMSTVSGFAPGNSGVKTYLSNLQSLPLLLHSWLPPLFTRIVLLLHSWLSPLFTRIIIITFLTIYIWSLWLSASSSKTLRFSDCGHLCQD